jgi:hypothetical protein
MSILDILLLLILILLILLIFIIGSYNISNNKSSFGNNNSEISNQMH